jgi:hypothetical protein
MHVNTNHPYLIGIDPGVTTGLCIYYKPEKRICQLRSGSLLEMLFLLRESIWWERINNDKVFIRMEDARLRTWVPWQKNEIAERGRREGAGYVKAHCAIWEDWFKIVGIPHELVAPKNNKTKVTAEYFKKLTGYDERTNEHQRDSAMLCVGY